MAWTAKKSMQSGGPKSRTLKAWGRASAICVVASPAILLVWDLFESRASDPIGSTTARIGLFLAIAGIAACVHFLAFLLIGLPLFLRYYSRPKSPLWRWLPGILTGTIVGIATVPMVLSLLYGRSIADSFLESAMAGGLYGSVTALACLLNRPSLKQI